MDHINLEKTGLQVSRLCLGRMTYGFSERGNNLWTLNEESLPSIQKALEQGINFFDAAPCIRMAPAKRLSALLENKGIQCN